MKVPQFDDDFIKASELFISLFERGNKSFGRVIKKMQELWPDPEFDLTKIDMVGSSRYKKVRIPFLLKLYCKFHTCYNCVFMVGHSSSGGPGGDGYCWNSCWIVDHYIYKF